MGHDAGRLFGGRRQPAGAGKSGAWWGALAALLTAFSVPAGAPASAEDMAQPSFFDSVEVRASDIAPFRKWQGALARDAAEREGASSAGCAPSLPGDECRYAEWQRFLDGLRDRDAWQQLVAVNREMNKRRYVPDPAAWGVEDYWESPGEFLTRAGGDCEDFAIAKFLSLKRLGWREDALRIAAVRDRAAQVGHAVLIVFYDGRSWLLDNQVQKVVETERVRDYLPVYSINEHFWWRHQPRS